MQFLQSHAEAAIKPFGSLEHDKATVIKWVTGSLNQQGV